jgi:hypothetical protein
MYGPQGYYSGYPPTDESWSTPYESESVEEPYDTDPVPAPPSEAHYYPHDHHHGPYRGAQLQRWTPSRY